METKGLKTLRIGLASPEEIRKWSYGEVLKPETINYQNCVPKKTVCFVEPSLDPHVIFTVIVENIRIVAKGDYMRYL